jgi:glycosyltransferase involved in cell wall biosynthesis
MAGMKILYVTPNATDPLAFYRGTGPLRRMREWYPVEFTFVEAVSWASIVMHDMVFMQRPFNTQHAEVLALAEKWGVPVVSDFDDWLYGLMPDNPAYSLYQKATDSLEKARTGSKAIMVSSEHLAKMYASKGSTNTVVVPNAYDSEMFTPADATDRRKIVLWRGGSSHTQDQLSVRQGWLELIRKHKDWQFMFINCYPWWLGEEFPNVKFLDGMNVIDYMDALKTLKPAIMTHPLLDSDFNRCKSMCSYIEAAHAGAAFVGPDFEEFERPGCVRYKAGSSESFFSSIDGLISHPELIVHAALEAQKEILGPLSLRTVNEIRWKLFNEIKDGKRAG